MRRSAGSEGQSGSGQAAAKRSAGRVRTAREEEAQKQARRAREERIAAAERRASRREQYDYDDFDWDEPEEKPRKKRIWPKILLGFLLVLILAGLLGGSLLWTMYGPTDEQYDLNTYYEIESQDQVGITVNNSVLVGLHGLMENGEVYVSYDVVREYLNDRIYWDPNENILLYTLPTETLRVEAGSTDCTADSGTQTKEYVIWKPAEETAYIALDFVQEHTDMEYHVNEEGTRRVLIVTEWGETRTAEAKRDTQVRYRGGFKSPALTELKKGEKVVVLDEVDDWTEVRTQDGLLGYVYGRSLTNKQTETLAYSGDFVEPEYTNIHKDYKISLGWHQVTSKLANGTLQDTLASTSGLNTISPTWFTIADNSGNLTSIATADYVDYAHQNGLEVWALVDNFGSNIDQMEVFSHTTARQNLIGQLISEANQYGIDGINVDFEQIPEVVGVHYIQFIRELSVACRNNGLVLSVDNYVPMGYNAHYNRKEQGIVADYFVIMGYDEHFGGSKEAGSVASYDYVKGGIEVALEEIPAEKVINGVPFYTRVWREAPKTDEELAAQAGTEDAEYPFNVSSEAMGMAAAAEQVRVAGAQAFWDETTKQNYAEWTGSDGATYRVWLEDRDSLDAKLSLMRDYQLAGVACWKLGFETSDIWELISQYVN